ncbi:MAG TPA: hypothetical protein HA315_01245 [Candidatus Thalassarchaeaceae archaeon]|nr:hypothetical protein [Euryarchaeota archaeon]DAC44859.1 MAG TPA: hypothetical protein D7H72_01235 [Candidatus Poseidoniales archaeon]HII34606.1 hypothetical protein [Candidatus Thalassarchaeaceae archaeon]|tara:strand:- start:22620 stop:23807 length:1188 start_codon:yes stop_codon:yes gene_type:complete
MVGDTGVSQLSNSLAGRRVILAVTGGIAAVESIKLCRELRRHGALVFPMMTKEATKVITPLALSWGSGTDIVSDWDPDMSQLDAYDGIIVAPATRNTIAKHLNGIIDSPVMMALSAARGSNTPIIFVPSMHSDLFDDPVTGDILSQLSAEGSHVIADQETEGKRKQPNHFRIVAESSHIINSELPGRKRVAITLGSNLAPIDHVRSIINYSSGATGWAISEYLYRMGHDVFCLAGRTSSFPNFTMPKVRNAEHPEEMLDEALKIASSFSPEVWIFSAAVLDYLPDQVQVKIPSSKDDIQIKLTPSRKHIPRVIEATGECYSIGFKLESNVDVQQLLERASSQISRYSMDVVFANRLEDLKSSSTPRAWLVESSGEATEIPNLMSLCNKIESLLAN